MPLFVFYPADRDPLDPFSPDGYGTQDIMRYVQENAINKFDLPKFPHLSEHEFSQSEYGEKVTYMHVIEAEERRKAANKKREARYKKEDL